MNRTYGLKSPFCFVTGTQSFWVVRDISLDPDQEKLMFHIASDDYFGVLGTVLGFCKDEISQKIPKDNQELLVGIDTLRKDLLFLRKNYKIVPKK